MRFPDPQRRAMLALKGVGPAVIARLEALGYCDLRQLRGASAADVTQRIAALVGSTCWRNSPQARAAIDVILRLAADMESLQSGAEPTHAEPRRTARNTRRT